MILMDVDGTLLPPPSTESRFILHLATRGKLGPVQVAAALAFYVRYGRRFGRHVGRKNKAYLTNLSCAEIARISADFVREQIVPCLRPEVVERLRRHQHAGEQVALLTGAPEFLAAPLAEALNVSLWCATRCACRGARFHWRPPLRHPLGTAKLDGARQLCEAENLSLRDTTAYADSIHDLALLEQVGRAVVVHPGRRLARIARTRGWELLHDAAAQDRLGVPD